MWFTSVNDKEFGEFYHGAICHWLYPQQFYLELVHPRVLADRSVSYLGLQLDNAAQGGRKDKRETREMIANMHGSEIIAARWKAAYEHYKAEKPEYLERCRSLIQCKSLGGKPIGLLWNRQRPDTSEAPRNLSYSGFRQLKILLEEAGCQPVLVGSDGPDSWKIDDSIVDFRIGKLGEFLKQDILSHVEQLLFYWMLVRGQPACSVGMQSGAMDGPAFFLGIPAIFAANQHSVSNGMQLLHQSPQWPFHWCPIEYGENGFQQFSASEEAQLREYIDRALGHSRSIPDCP